MNTLLLQLSMGFASINLVVACLVIGNRFIIRRKQRRYDAEVRRLKPKVLDWIDGNDDAPRPRNRVERRVLVDLLSRYGRQLTGDGRTRITELASSRGLIDELVDRAGSPWAWKRAEALFRLGDIGDGQTELLVAGLSDRDRSVRNAAARSLGKQRSVEGVASIVLALSTGRVARAVGGQALMDIGAPAADALAGLLASKRSEVRAVAAELMGRVGTAEHGRQLAGHLTDPDPEVRVAAVRALGRLGGRAAAAAVPGLLDDRVPFVRAAAATAVGKLGRRQHVDRLIDMALDDDFLPAHAAAAAVVQIDSPAAQRAAVGTGNVHLIEALDMIGESV